MNSSTIDNNAIHAKSAQVDFLASHSRKLAASWCVVDGKLTCTWVAID